MKMLNRVIKHIEENSIAKHNKEYVANTLDQRELMQLTMLLNGGIFNVGYTRMIVDKGVARFDFPKGSFVVYIPSDSMIRIGLLDVPELNVTYTFHNLDGVDNFLSLHNIHRTPISQNINPVLKDYAAKIEILSILAVHGKEKHISQVAPYDVPLLVASINGAVYDLDVRDSLTENGFITFRTPPEQSKHHHQDIHFTTYGIFLKNDIVHISNMTKIGSKPVPVQTNGELIDYLKAENVLVVEVNLEESERVPTDIKQSVISPD